MKFVVREVAVDSSQNMMVMVVTLTVAEANLLLGNVRAMWTMFRQALKVFTKYRSNW